MNKTKRSFEKREITIAYANSLKGRDKRYFVSDSFPGLTLKVEVSGHKSWVYLYRAKGRKPRQMSIGSYQTTSPAKARERVKIISKDLMLGKDPLEDRDKLKVELTLKEALTNYLNNSLTVSNSYRRSTITAVRNIFRNWIFRKSNNPDVRKCYNGLIDLQHKKISSITVEDIKKLHRHVGGTSPIVANRLVQYLRLAFNTFMKNRKNPCTVVKKDLYQEHVYDDYLNNIEFERVLDNAFKVDSRNGLLLRSHYKDNLLNPVACVLIAFRLMTARRTISEASCLPWSGVRNDRIILKETKTSKYNTPTTFYLAEKAKDILQTIRREKLQRYDQGPMNKDWFRNRFVFPVHDERAEYVFPSRDYGRRIANGKKGSKPYLVDVRATWKKLLEMSGVNRWLKPYATRHSLATYILNNGGNINQVMKVLGCSMATAMRYAKLVPGAELEILNKIGQKTEKKLVQVK